MPSLQTSRKHHSSPLRFLEVWRAPPFCEAVSEQVRVALGIPNAHPKVSRL